MLCEFGTPKAHEVSLEEGEDKEEEMNSEASFHSSDKMTLIDLESTAQCKSDLFEDY